MSLSSFRVFQLLACRLLLALAAGLQACATPHPLTRANELHPGSGLYSYYNRGLDVHLKLFGDYNLTLQPPNRPDYFTRIHLRPLLTAGSKPAVLFTGYARLEPFFQITGVFVAGQPAWSKLGFVPLG
ncbi:MAG TPA: hypothetical protein VF598_07915, partial [Hymenobacter sp.]